MKIKKDNEYILLYWNDSNKQIQLGGIEDTYCNAQFKVVRRYNKDTNITTTQLFLVYAPDKQIIVTKQDWRVTAVSKVSKSTLHLH